MSLPELTQEELKEQLQKAPLGVLNEEQLKALSALKIIDNVNENNFDCSSIDLTLSDEIWKLNSTSKIQTNDRQNVEGLITSLHGEKIIPSADDGYHKIFQLTSGPKDESSVYIAKLNETVHLNRYRGSAGIYGKASGKSTFGRLDVLTRLITDNNPKYDEVNPFYTGNLYLEIIPISFNIEVKVGQAFHQLRLFKGRPKLSLLLDHDLASLAPMLFNDQNKPIDRADNILSLSLLKDPKHGCIAFKAIEDAPILKTHIDSDDSKQTIHPEVYWEKITPESAQDNSLRMVTNKFYILRSKERLFLPEDIAVSCVAYSENLGELRIHYAGFAHPNFGKYRRDEEDTIGTPLIFEARCHSFRVKLQDNEPFAKIEFYRMSKPTKKSGETKYQNQELQLSKIFKDWKNENQSN